MGSSHRFEPNIGITIHVFPPSNQKLIIKILSWNIRDLNGTTKHIILRNILKQENMDLVMLQETKCNRKSMESIARKIWKPCEFICSEEKGASRVLSFLWNQSKIRVEMKS